MSSKKARENIFSKIKTFLQKNEQKLVLLVGFFLISAISFEFGVLQGQKWQQKPMIIEKQANTPTETQTSENGDSGASSTISAEQNTFGNQTKSTTNSIPVSSTNCAYVGSKNSNKFYPPTCSYAKRIKPENIVCFSSADEALKQGRTESKCN